MNSFSTCFCGIAHRIVGAARSMGLPLAFLVIAALASTSKSAYGWGAGHGPITEAALATLPPWEKELLGKELALLATRHCVIPDEVHTKPEVRKYAMMDSKPGVVYLVGLHLPATAPENYEVLRYFLKRAVDQFKDGRVDEGARYTGTLAHALEDWGCPAHSVPGDNMFTLFKQFLPPPESQRYVALHGPVENGKFKIDLADYRPRLLGASIDEAAFNLLQRVEQSTIHARSQVIPILQATYAGDEKASAEAQKKAGEFDATVVADAIHTVLCLAKDKLDPEALRELRQVDLSARIPLESEKLFVPQSSFFSKPYWGHAVRGATLRDGKEAVPLKLIIQDQGRTEVRQFDAGLGVGTKNVMTYLVPEGVYQRFEAWAGLHSELGKTGNVVFEVNGNGDKVLAKVTIAGDTPAQRIGVPLAGIKTIQLITTSAGGDGLGNYAVWGEPKLVKE